MLHGGKTSCLTQSEAMRCRFELAQSEAMRCRKKRSDALSVGTLRGVRLTSLQRTKGIDAVVHVALEANLDGRRNRNRPEDDARRHTANPRTRRSALRSIFPFEFNGILGIT